MSSPPQREHDEGDEIVRVVEAVGRADGDLDPVVGCFESGVGAAQLDGPEDVRPTTADLPGWLAALVQLHDLPFERLVVVAGMFRVGYRRPPISCHSSLIGLSNTL